MTKPLVTVGITCYAEGDWLLECWESLLAQTDDRWEAVLVMDGTEHQRTAEIFEALSHPRLRKARMPRNEGPYPTRNRAFEITETPYHFYLDGDDKLPPDIIQRVYRAIEAHPGVPLLYGDVQRFGAKSDLWRIPAAVDPEAFVREQVIPAGSIYLRSMWERLGGFAPELARGNADYDFHIGLVEAGVRGVHLGGVAYLYRMGHAARVSSSYRLRYDETHRVIVRRHPQYFASPRRRELFLAYGEKQAAVAHAANGDPARAAELSRSAIWRGLWWDRTLWPLAIGGRLPWSRRAA